MTLEIQFVGKGGQGIMFLGLILSRAAVIYDEKNATNIQSYESRMRGGTVVSDVIISDEDIICPIVTRPDILVALNDEGLNEFTNNLKKGGLLLIDENARISLKNNFKIFRVPSIRIAESELNSITTANMIMLGALIGITDIVSEESVLNSLLDVMEQVDVKEGMKKKNIQALIRGIKLGRELANKNSS
ncbi:MAG: 2-oxoacid:acceptor oxidoreductase family protein [Candidatus Jordarchaeaceae archaeon]